MEENKENLEIFDETAELPVSLTENPSKKNSIIAKEKEEKKQILSKKEKKENTGLKKFIAAFFSVILATGLWAYVINVVNPPQSVVFRDIPVQILGLDTINSTRLTIAGDGIYTVDVTAKASRSEINAVTASDINASINLTGLSAGPNYIPVKVTGPNNVDIEDVRSAKIQVYIEELVTEQKPIKISHANIEGDYEVTITAMETDSVLVTGAKSLVDMISEVHIDLDINSLEVDKLTTSRLTGIPIDADGNEVKNVKISHSQIYVTAVIYQVKEIPLDINYYGSPGLGAQLSHVEHPSGLKVKANSLVLKDLKSISTEAIMIEGILDDTTMDVNYKLPDNVYLADCAEKPVITFTLVHTGQISFTYQTSEVRISAAAPEDCEKYTLPKLQITVTAKGDLSTIRKLEAKDLQPCIDLSGLKEGDNVIALKTDYSNKKISIKISPSSLTVNAKMIPEEIPEEILPETPAEEPTVETPPVETPPQNQEETPAETPAENPTTTD